MTANPQPTEQTSLNLAIVLQKMLAVSDKVSDLIFSPGRPPQIELVGKLQPVEIAGLEKLSPAQTAGIAKLIIGSHEEPAIAIPARIAVPPSTRLTATDPVPAMKKRTVGYAASTHVAGDCAVDNAGRSPRRTLG